VVNIFTFGFTLFFALNEMERVVRDDVSGAYNFAMAAVLALAVVIVGESITLFENVVEEG
jgi:hypothetical protein